MPLSQREALIALFRENPELIPRCLKSLRSLKIPRYDEVNVIEVNTNTNTNSNRNANPETENSHTPGADLYVLLRNRQGKSVLAVNLEVRDSVDKEKFRSWPADVAFGHARFGCATLLVVVTADPAVAAWAEKPIDLGLALSFLHPIVLGPSVIPVMSAPDNNRRNIALSVLSAMVHGNGRQGGPVVLNALKNAARCDAPQALRYSELIYFALEEPKRRELGISAPKSS